MFIPPILSTPTARLSWVVLMETIKAEGGGEDPDAVLEFLACLIEEYRRQLQGNIQVPRSPENVWQVRSPYQTLCHFQPLCQESPPSHVRTQDQDQFRDQGQDHFKDQFQDQFHAQYPALSHSPSPPRLELQSQAPCQASYPSSSPAPPRAQSQGPPFGQALGSAASITIFDLHNPPTLPQGGGQTIEPSARPATGRLSGMRGPRKSCLVEGCPKYGVLQLPCRLRS